jgi:hypothetical protein
LKYFPHFQGGVVGVTADGEHAGAGHGWTFTYSLYNTTTGGVVVFTVPPINLDEEVVDDGTHAACECMYASIFTICGALMLAFVVVLWYVATRFTK